MLRIRWSSTSPATHHSAPPTPAPVNVDALFTQWQAATDKGEFISRLDLATCQALTSLICARIPSRYVPKPRKEKRHAESR